MGLRLAVIVLCFMGLGCTERLDAFRDDPPPRGESEQERRSRLGIRVDLVDGPPVPMARLLANSVAEELIRYDVPATTAPGGGARFVLKGRTQLNRSDPRIPFIVLIHWSLHDRGGNPIGTHIQGVEGSWWQWAHGDPRIIRTAGKKAAKAFATLLQGNDDIVMPLEMHRAGIVVARVEGAPGDGNTALTHAMADALRQADVAVTEDPRQAAYILNGQVSVGEPVAGRQAVRIEWAVSTFDGTRVGRASQENTVPADSLVGAWTAIAPMAASAAVEGIRVVLENPRRGPRGRAVPPLPPPLNLPELRRPVPPEK